MPDDAFPASARRVLLAWYEAHRRILPMRAPGVSAWATLVFEVMSQQTPIPRVQPIWERWMELWPTPQALAAAPQASVLVEWRHLGYPSRALRLHECAQAIVERHGGEVPRSQEDLLALPGIGPYTASALGSFQFHQRIPVLDTNIRRVLGRLLDGREFAPKSAPTRTEVSRARDLLPEDGRQAATWNVALMEFGALVCTQRSAQCEGCALTEWCAWRASGYPRAEVRPRGQAWKGTDRQARGRVMAALRRLHTDEAVHASEHSSSLSGGEGASPLPLEGSVSTGRDASALSLRFPSLAGTSAPVTPSLSWEDALAAATLPEAENDVQARRVVEALVRDGLVVREESTGRIRLPL